MHAVAERASRRAEIFRFINININIPRELAKATGSLRSFQPVGFSFSILERATALVLVHRQRSSVFLDENLIRLLFQVDSSGNVHRAAASSAERAASNNSRA